MSHTPAAAKALWCPMVRALNGDDQPCNSGNGPDYRQPSYARCIADDCAMWRWVHTSASVPVKIENGATIYEIKETKTHGYCGLAGRSA
jgi:hypothetical protein